LLKSGCRRAAVVKVADDLVEVETGIIFFYIFLMDKWRKFAKDEALTKQSKSHTHKCHT